MHTAPVSAFSATASVATRVLPRRFSFRQCHRDQVQCRPSAAHQNAAGPMSVWPLHAPAQTHQQDIHPCSHHDDGVTDLVYFGAHSPDQDQQNHPHGHDFLNQSVIALITRSFALPNRLFAIDPNMLTPQPYGNPYRTAGQRRGDAPVST